MWCRGCNALEALKLECPRLATLDATFCTQLDSLALIRALKGAPRLDALVLSVCLGLDPILPSIFNALSHLSLLDLSYTGLAVACLPSAPLMGPFILPLFCVGMSGTLPCSQALFATGSSDVSLP